MRFVFLLSTLALALFNAQRKPRNFLQSRIRELAPKRQMLPQLRLLSHVPPSLVLFSGLQFPAWPLKRCSSILPPPPPPLPQPRQPFAHASLWFLQTESLLLECQRFFFPLEGLRSVFIRVLSDITRRKAETGSARYLPRRREDGGCCGYRSVYGWDGER